MKNKTTIHAIARELGISIGTVDRALHNRAGISAATKTKVLDLVAAYQYKPDRIASSLSRKAKSIRIGVILQSVPEFFWSNVQKGVLAAEAELADFGLEIILRGMSTMRKSQEIIQLIDELAADQVDAIALVPTNDSCLREKIARTSSQGIKFITLNDDIEDSDRIFYVGPQMRQSGRIAGELMGRYLKGEGNVAVINSDVGSVVYQERLAGFREILGSRYEKIRILTTYTYDFPNRKENLDQVIQGVLENLTDITGIYDIDGASLYNIGLLVKNQKIPGQVIIIGHEIWQEVENLMAEGIIQVCISQDPFAQGYLAVKLLFDYLLNGSRPAQDRLFTRVDIIIRENLTIQDNILNPFSRPHYSAALKL